MKKGLFLFVFVFTLSYAHTQQLMLEVFSGVNSTAYDSPGHNDTQWYVPIGVRIAGGHEHVQLGIEYRKNITHPVFETEVLREEFDETYKGLFLRGNFSSLPAYRFGLVLKAGAGYYENTYNTYTLPVETLNESYKFERTNGWNLGIGVSSPIYTILHWEIGYQYNHLQRPEDALIYPGSKASYHSFQMGLSINLVFGNTQKKCRRVLSR